jgi:G3E family GTPase
MQTTTYSQVPNLDWILNANCFGGSKRLEELDTIFNQAIITTEQEEEEQEEAQPPPSSSSSSSTHDHHDHSHSHDHHSGGVDDSCAICTNEQPLPVPQHKHTAAVKTLAFQHTGSVDLSKLNQWLAQVLWPNQDETDKVLTAMLKDPLSNAAAHKTSKENNTTQQIFRIKGIVSVHCSSEEEMDDDDDTDDKAYYVVDDTQNNNAGFLDRRRYIVQAVHDLWEVHPASDDLQWEEGELREGKLVLIGKYLQRDVLQQGFLSCFVT